MPPIPLQLLRSRRLVGFQQGNFAHSFVPQQRHSSFYQRNSHVFAGYCWHSEVTGCPEHSGTHGNGTELLGIIKDWEFGRNYFSSKAHSYRVILVEDKRKLLIIIMVKCRRTLNIVVIKNKKKVNEKMEFWKNNPKWIRQPAGTN